MLRFEREVRLNGNASPAEVATRLSRLVAPQCSFSSNQRGKPLRGHVSNMGGVVRWPLVEYRISSPRSLEFHLERAPHGCILAGRFLVWRAMQVVVVGWLACGLAVWSFTLLRDLFQHSVSHNILLDFGAILLCLGIAIGYLSLFVWLGRNRDADLVRSLRIVLGSEEGAFIAEQIFSRTTSVQPSFIDDPDSLGLPWQSETTRIDT